MSSNLNSGAPARTIAPVWISVARAAKSIGCSHNQVLNMLQDGRLIGYQDAPRPGRRSGSWWKVDYASVVEYVGRMRSARLAAAGIRHPRFRF
jgi:hypothetical protein